MTKLLHLIQTRWTKTARRQDGKTVAEVAIAHANVDALRILVDSGVDVNKLLACGGSLLHMAIWLGARDHGAEVAKTMATMLPDRGASPNGGFDEKLAPKYGSTPCHTPVLFLAVMMRGSSDVVQLLLERGADQFLPYTQDRKVFHRGTIGGFDKAYSTKSLAANVAGGIVDGGTCREDPDVLRKHALRKLELLVQYGGGIDATLRGYLRRHEDFFLARLSIRQRTLNGEDLRPVRKAPVNTTLQAYGVGYLCGA
ncbi:ankyrin repeat-containing domain protein [Apiospora saccharicola]|uniref:Ankyrin repeat-containing domain protein n=1 Tax=Apiospora saccharicola TaxID=335842 RepID=A0ABR1UZ30_9PEZI